MGDRWQNMKTALTGRQHPLQQRWTPRAAPPDQDPVIYGQDYDFTAARDKAIPYPDLEDSLRTAVDDEFAPKIKDPKSSQVLAEELAQMEHELARARTLIATAEIEIAKKRTELNATIERERQEELKMHTDRLAELDALRPTNGGGLPNAKDHDYHGGTAVAVIPERDNGAGGTDAGVPVAGADSQGQSNGASALPAG